MDMKSQNVNTNQYINRKYRINISYFFFSFTDEMFSSLSVQYLDRGDIL